MRQEYKFLIADKRLAHLQSCLGPFVRLDPYTQDRKNHEYIVRSIYFDTTSLLFYHEKIAGLKDRKKIRIRAYNEHSDSSRIFLEIKRKHENFINKSRAPINYTDLDSFFTAREPEQFIVNGNSKRSCSQFLYYVNAQGLKPTVLVVYDRAAFFSKFNSDLRITIDKNLRFYAFPEFFELFDDAGLQQALNGYSILEIKFNRGFPSWLQKIIKDFGLTRQALSKYTMCLDAQKNLFPENRRSILPFNRALPSCY